MGIKISKEFSQKFNKVIGDDNPIHKDRNIVPGMLLYEISAHMLDNEKDTRIHNIQFKKMINYDDEIEINKNNSEISIYRNGNKAFELIPEKNKNYNFDFMEIINKDNKINKNANLNDVLEIFGNYFKEENYFKNEFNENDRRAALASIIVGALSTDFYNHENNHKNIILRNGSFKFDDKISDKFKIYKYEKIEGTKGKIYLAARDPNDPNKIIAKGYISVVSFNHVIQRGNQK